MIATDQPGARKTCSACGGRFPATAFRLRSRASGRRHTECKACWTEYMARWRGRQREADLKQIVRQLAAATSLPQVAATVAKLSRRFGGPQRAVARMAKYVRQLAETRPGSRIMLQTCRALANIVRTAEACNNAPP